MILVLRLLLLLLLFPSLVLLALVDKLVDKTEVTFLSLKLILELRLLLLLYVILPSLVALSKLKPRILEIDS
jgi:hypothetical protein